MTTAGGPMMTGRLADLAAWCRERPLVCGLAGFALLVAGGWVFLQATGVRSIGYAVVLAILSAVIGGFGLLLLNEPIAHFVGRPGNRRLGQLLGAGGVVGGIVVAAVAVWLASPVIALIGSVLIILGLLAVYAGLVLRGDANPGRWLIGGLVLLVAVPVLLWIADGVDGWSIAAAVVWVAGLVSFKIGLGPWIDQAEDPIRERNDVAVTAVAATAVGLVLLVIASRSFDEAILLIGLALVFVGLSALGIAIVRFRATRAIGYWALALGGLAVVAAAVLVDGLLSPFDLVAAAVLALAGIGAWFVFRGEAVIAVLLLGFLLGWVLVDRTSDADLSPTPASLRTVVAFGDSYIAGEGAPRFFPGTNRVGPDGNQCRRAPTAYPYLVADRLGSDLVFLACSGARTADLDGEGDPPVPYPDVAGDDDQLQRFAILHRDRIGAIDAVLVSIGGNDVGFSTIIQACLLPQNCAAEEAGRVERWLENVRRSGPTLTRTFQTIRQTVGDDTPVVAMLYPAIVRPDPDCDLAIDEDEIDFVARFTEALNAELRASAEAAGVNVIDLSDAFDGRLLCDEDPATNFIQLAPTEGPIADRLLPANWTHGSLHPREDGHRLIADRLIDENGTGELADLIAAVAAGGPANPPPGSASQEEPNPPVYQELPDDEWIRDRLYETVADLILPVGLLLLGGLVAAFGILRIEVPILSFLEPGGSRSGSDPVGSDGRSTA
ncbi:MAG: SGNH/GDSL hydrolase family protein [Actinomycetota bacterium]